MWLIRKLLSIVILFFDRLFTPKLQVARSETEQAKVDAQTATMSLYQLAGCPFCVKVRRHFKRRNLKIELRDVGNEPRYREELVREGGQYQVPCLRLTDDDGTVRWLYESSDIISYLDSRFP